MSTWWTPAHRVDIGLRADDIPNVPFSITNRGWYALYGVMSSLRVRHVEQLAEPDVYVPTQLAQHWGNSLALADLGDWLQVGRYDGRAVVFAGLAHLSQADSLGDRYELSPLPGSDVGRWLYALGQELATTPSGLVISGRPRKGSAMVNLEKGGKVDLTKAAGGTLTKVRVGLGWDVRKTDGAAYDLDAQVIVCDANGKSIGPDWFVFYNNPTSPNGAVVHQGDNLTGSGKGDDEQIVIDFTKLPAEVQDLVVTVTIHKASERGQSFGLVDNAFVRVIDETTGTELARYDLTEDTEAGVNALEFGKFYPRNGSWNFRALGDGYKDELNGFIRSYNI